MDAENVVTSPNTTGRAILAQGQSQVLDNKSLIKGFATTPSGKLEAAPASVEPASVKTPGAQTPSRRPPLADTSSSTPRAAPESAPISTPRVSSTPARKLQSQQQQQQSSTGKQQQRQYEVVFPAGPMGLELEPVIISSERQLGCRVKDFYFGLDHTGVGQDFIMSKVTAGDVIYQVNGQAVLSFPFQDVLDLLKGLKSSTRTIVFKNISAEWGGGVRGGGRPMTPQQSTLQRALLVASRVTQVDPRALASMHLSNVPSDLEAYSVVQPVTPMKGATTSTTTPSRLTLSPKAVRDLSKSVRGAAAAAAAAVAAGGCVVSEPTSTYYSSSSTTSTNPTPSFASASNDLKRVLSTVGSTLGLGTELGLAASAATVSKKHVLLNELSRSCVMLGLAEDKQQQLAEQLTEARKQESDTKQQLQQTQDQLADATAAIESLRHELVQLASQRDTKSLTASAADAESRLVYEELTREKALCEQALQNADELKAYSSELREQLDVEQRQYEELQDASRVLRDDLDRERLARSREQVSFKGELDRLGAEQKAIRGEVEAEFQAALAQLQKAERDRDTAMAEADVLRDLSHNDHASAEAEVQRLRESLVTQSTWHKEHIAAKELEMDTLRVELNEARSTADKLLQRKEEALRTLGDTQETSESLQSVIDGLRAELRLCEERLSSAGFEFACVVEDREELDRRLKDLEQEREQELDEREQEREALASQKTTIDRLLRDLVVVRDEARLQQEDIANHVLLLRAAEARCSESEIARAEHQAMAEQHTAATAIADLIQTDLRSALESADVELQCLRAEVEVRVQEMAKLEQSISEFKTRAATQLAEVQQQGEQAKELAAAQIAELQLQIVQANEQAAKHIAEVQAEIAQTKEQAAAQVAKAQAEISHVKEQAAEDVAEALEQAAREETEAQQLVTTQIAQAKEQAIAQVTDAQQQVDSARAALKDQLLVADVLKQRCEEQQAAIQMSIELQAEAEGLIAKQTAALEASNEQKKQTERESVALTRELHNCQAALDEQTAENASLVRIQASARERVRNVCTQMSSVTVTLRAQLANTRAALAELADHNFKLMQAFSAAEEEKGAMSMALADEQALRNLAVDRASQLETAAVEAEQRANEAAGRALESDKRAVEAEKRAAAMESDKCDAEAQKSLAMERFSTSQESLEVELAALRQYCEDERVAYLALQDQLRERDAAASLLEERLAEARASHDALLAAARVQESKASERTEQMVADTTASHEAQLADLKAQHAAVVEGFRAERARILGSYEHMLEESRRCTLKAATQQHEQYEVKLQTLREALGAEQHQVQRALAEALARVDQSQSTLSDMDQQLVEARTASERSEQARLEAEKECAMLRGLVSTSVRDAREAADRYLQQAKVEVANAASSAQRAATEMHTAQQQAKEANAAKAEAERRIAAGVAAQEELQRECDGRNRREQQHLEECAHLERKLEEAHAAMGQIRLQLAEAHSALEKNRDLQAATEQQRERQAANEESRRMAQLETSFAERARTMEAAFAERTRGFEAGFAERARGFELHIADLGAALAESRGETIHTRQALLNSRAELDALHSQVTELLSSVGGAGAPECTEGGRVRGGGGDDGLGAAGRCNDENAPPLGDKNKNKYAVGVTSGGGGGGGVGAGAGAGGGRPNSNNVAATTLLSSRAVASRFRENSSKRAERMENPLRDITQDETKEECDCSTSDNDDEDDNDENDAANFSTDISTSQWHDRLVMLALDLHEALVFALVEQAANAKPGTSSENALTDASKALQVLHDHSMKTPWTLAAGSPVQSLPPAHEMVALMGGSGFGFGTGLRPPLRHQNQSVASSQDSAKVFLSETIMDRLASTTSLQSQQESELWEARAQIEALNLQLSATTTARKPAPPLAGGGGGGGGKVAPDAPAERVGQLVRELSALLDEPAATNALAQERTSEALSRLVRQVAGHYRHRRKDSQQLSGLIDGDSFDSVNTGERDDSDFWDVSESMDEV